MLISSLHFAVLSFTIVVKNIKSQYVRYTLFFVFIRTSNFGAKAERSYIFLRFEAGTVTWYH